MDTAQQIVKEIYGMGMSDSSIADAVASTQPTIWRIRNGKTKACGSDLYAELVRLRNSKRKKNVTRKAA